jgi:anti-anti-sigma factor
MDAEQDRDRGSAREGALDPVGHLPEGAENLPRRERFRCDLQVERDTVLVRLHGELDLETIDEAQEIMAEASAGRRGVTLDLRGLHFIDSSGLNLIIQMAALGRADGFGFSVIPSESPGVQRLFAATGAERYLAFVEPGDRDPGG